MESNALVKHSTMGQENFVSHFFQTSRLHFLSTWRNEFQAQLTEYIQNLCEDDQEKEEEHEQDFMAGEDDLLNSDPEDSLHPITHKMERVIMHVDMVLATSTPLLKQQHLGLFLCICCDENQP
jgi:hypothetical protein